MPIDYKKYPKNWKEIRARILERANNRCELCFAPNKKEVYRIKDYGEFYGMWTWAEFQGWKKVKVVLTIHHINGDITDNRDCNLIALCQRCHLRLDMCRHIKNRKKRR